MLSAIDWRVTFPAPPLAAGAVHLWRVRLRQPAPICERLVRRLDTSERTRAAHFAFDRDRDGFLVAHGALREVLASYLARQPEALRFAASAQGKPEIEGTDLRSNDALHFSLTHSGDIALVAVTRIGAIGVDVEQMRADVEVLALAERFFAAAECEELRALPVDRRLTYFYALWTCKEACLKAQGAGLTAPLRHVRVHFDSDGAPTFTLADADAASRWSQAQISPEEGYAGAVAVEGHIEALAQYAWNADTW